MYEINEFLILFLFYEKPSTTILKQLYDKAIGSTASNKNSLWHYTESDLNYKTQHIRDITSVANSSYHYNDHNRMETSKATKKKKHCRLVVRRVAVPRLPRRKNR